MHVGAVRQNHVCRNARDSDIEAVIKEWLRTSSNRNGAKKPAKRNVPPPPTFDDSGASDVEI